MRWMLGICAAAGCVLVGLTMASGCRRRVKVLTELAAGVDDLRVHMTRMLEPAPQALSFTDCPALRQVGAAMTPGVSAREAWAKVRAEESRRGGQLDALTREDLEALDSLFEHLGESGRVQQERLLTDAARALERNLESARESAGEAERLYVSLGVLTGLMLALIVI